MPPLELPAPASSCSPPSCSSSALCFSPPALIPRALPPFFSPLLLPSSSSPTPLTMIWGDAVYRHQNRARRSGTDSTAHPPPSAACRQLFPNQIDCCQRSEKAVHGMCSSHALFGSTYLGDGVQILVDGVTCTVQPTLPSHFPPQTMRTAEHSVVRGVMCCGVGVVVFRCWK